MTTATDLAMPLTHEMAGAVRGAIHGDLQALNHDIGEQYGITTNHPDIEGVHELGQRLALCTQVYLELGNEHLHIDGEVIDLLMEFEAEAKGSVEHDRNSASDLPLSEARLTLLHEARVAAEEWQRQRGGGESS